MQVQVQVRVQVQVQVRTLVSRPLMTLLLFMAAVSHSSTSPELLPTARQPPSPTHLATAQHIQTFKI